MTLRRIYFFLYELDFLDSTHMRDHKEFVFLYLCCLCMRASSLRIYHCGAALRIYPLQGRHGNKTALVVTHYLSPLLSGFRYHKTWKEMISPNNSTQRNFLTHFSPLFGFWGLVSFVLSFCSFYIFHITFMLFLPNSIHSPVIFFI